MKKIISLLSTVCIMVMLIFPVLAFTDVPNKSWYSTAVDFCASRGYVTGYKDGTFKPNNNITRAELAAVMSKYLGLTSPANNSFADVPNGKWYTSPVLNCVKAGIITGYSATKFGPNDKVTREQAAVILAKAFNVDKASGRTTFSDDSSISGWAVGQVKAMKQVGLISGVGNNKFAPKANVTRAAICQMIYSGENRQNNSDSNDSVDERIIGNWTLDVEKTNENNSMSVTAILGTGVRNGTYLKINEDGSMRCFAGYGLQGEGTYSRNNDSTYTYVLDDYNGAILEDVFRIEDDNLVLYYGGSKVYWEKT